MQGKVFIADYISIEEIYVHFRALVFAYLEKEKEEAECKKYREQMDFSSLDDLSGNETAVEARSDL